MFIVGFILTVCDAVLNACLVLAALLGLVFVVMALGEDWQRL